MKRRLAETAALAIVAATLLWCPRAEATAYWARYQTHTAYASYLATVGQFDYVLGTWWASSGGGYGLFDFNIALIIGIMILVGGINMITALLVLILERTPMIGILSSNRSNQSRPPSVDRIWRNPIAPAMTSPRAIYQYDVIRLLVKMSI